MASLVVLPVGFEKAERLLVTIKDRARTKDLLTDLNENGETTEICPRQIILTVTPYNEVYCVLYGFIYFL